VTRQKTFKRKVRARMEKTGERYAVARAQLVGDAGVHPECSALRTLLAEAGVEVSEPLVLLMAGGAGAAAMAFRYEAEDFTHFHLSGWNPFQSDIRAACERLGLQPDVHETGGRVAAERALREHVPAIAWVDLAELQYAALPQEYSGASYHVVVVEALDEAVGVALIRDRAPRPIEVPLERLAVARARIRKDRHRLLTLPAGGYADVAAAVRAGLQACVAGPSAPTPAMSLDGIASWADRLHGSRAKQSWAAMFPPGRHLWGALRDLADGVEHRGSGGGLMRAMQAAGLREAAALLERPALAAVADRTAQLAAGWSELAEAALPGDVPAFARTRELLARRERLLRTGPDTEALAAVAAALAELEREVDADFPLADPDGLLAGLQASVRALHADEVATRDALAAAVR
jgi:hypothetical protein